MIFHCSIELIGVNKAGCCIMFINFNFYNFFFSLSKQNTITSNLIDYTIKRINNDEKKEGKKKTHIHIKPEREKLISP